MSPQANRLTRAIVPFSLLTGFFLSLATAPLALYGPKQLTLELEGVFRAQGELRSLAVPYLTGALAVSSGLGTVGVILIYGRRRARQRAELRHKVTELKAAIAERERWLVDLSLSAARLEDGDQPTLLSEAAEIPPLKEVLSTILDRLIQTEPVSVETPPEPATSSESSGKSTAASGSGVNWQPDFTPAAMSPAPTPLRTVPAEPAPPAAIQTLERQVEQLTAQIRLLQGALSTSISPAGPGYQIIRDPNLAPRTES